MYGNIGFTRMKRREEKPLTNGQRKRLDALLKRYEAISADDDMSDADYEREAAEIRKAMDAIHAE